MSEKSVEYRNIITHGLYKHILKPMFFLEDPEKVHDKMTDMGIFLSRYSFGKKMTEALFDYQNPILSQKIFNIHFENPVGLSAGFDKDAKLTGILPFVGFGFAEVGSITGKACQGNPKPRLWRLKEAKSLAVYYGLKNEGCDKIAKRLEGQKFEIPIGMSVAMTNCQENINIKNAVLDYLHAFKTMYPYSQYMTINISCPNTSGGQPFIIPHNLDYLLDVIDTTNPTKPVFLKLSPDMSFEDMQNIITIIKKHKVDGVICTNLTKRKEKIMELGKNTPIKGGLSGKAVDASSDKMISYMYKNLVLPMKKEGKDFVIIGSGGIFNAEDAYRKIRLGSSLLQMITGMIFEGPQVISEINQGLVKLLKRDGFKNIEEAVGVEHI
ncbi:MAG: quinone-dependent dihydroorotate dehydrogenase [Candidatus Pacebacteria bacterium]|nr:quinone-dependent dihydroorotate dehydrogenase [Candidatus Paceibacterota bacterium]MCF7862706.1 quinone-dependent dihydroorotate dehydrogenase [Candidatus Paceibacterota bacterium]